MDPTLIAKLAMPAFQAGKKYFEDIRYRGHISAFLRDEIIYKITTGSSSVKEAA